MSRADLEKLSKKELIEAYLELQAKLQRPAKTSRTSSKPPSTDKKQRRETSKPGGAKPGHKGASRRLADNPDAVVDHRPDTCGNCGEVFPVDVSETVIGEYDAIDLPPVAPVVERHRRLQCVCSGCGATTKRASAASRHGLTVRADDPGVGILSEAFPARLL